jgi:hypothetical protein
MSGERSVSLGQLLLSQWLTKGFTKWLYCEGRSNSFSHRLFHMESVPRYILPPRVLEFKAWSPFAIALEDFKIRSSSLTSRTINAYDLTQLLRQSFVRTFVRIDGFGQTAPNRVFHNEIIVVEDDIAPADRIGLLVTPLRKSCSTFRDGEKWLSAPFLSERCLGRCEK